MTFLVLTDRFRNLQMVRTFVPGLLVALIVALAAQFLGAHYGAPIMLFALLLGMSVNFLADDARTVPGIIAASRQVLKAGVALMGLRVDAGDLGALGAAGITTLAALLGGTILMGILLARLMHQDWRFGLLTGGAVAICGASAALAIASVLPGEERLERETIFTVVAITGFSTVAMIFYPILLHWLGFSDMAAGFVIGASIHDVAQVVGAGYSISDRAGDFATIVKMLRVAALPIVLIIIVLLTGRQGRQSVVSVPGFLIVFALLAVLNSAGMIPTAVAAFASRLSQEMMIIAIAALGVRTSLGSMVSIGAEKILMVAGLTFGLLAAALICAGLLFP